MQRNVIEAVADGFQLTQSEPDSLRPARHIISALGTADLSLDVMPLASILPSIITVCNNCITHTFFPYSLVCS